MTFRSSLLAGVACVALAAACSSPDDDEPGAPPAIPPAGAGQTGGGAGGTGGAPPLANGGTGGAPSGLGQGGTGPLAQGGTGGAPAGGAGGAPAAGTGLDLIPNADGFVFANTNAVGVQGAFFTAADTGGSTIAPAAFTGTVTNGDVCVSGTAALIPPNPDEDPAVVGDEFEYGTTWGTIVGLNLSQPNDAMTGAPSMIPQPFNRAVAGQGTVNGFSFTLTGTQIPPAASIRFKTTFPSAPGSTTASPQEFCLPLAVAQPAPGAAGTTYTATINSQTAECWNPGGVAFSSAQLLSLQLQIVTSTTAAVPFNFCIADLKAITTP
ncbi:MAG: hypothetical protein ABW217_09620 [Polyangiaceae bacterium]